MDVDHLAAVPKPPSTKQGLLIVAISPASPFVVSLSNRERKALRQAQDQRNPRLLKDPSP